MEQHEHTAGGLRWVAALMVGVGVDWWVGASQALVGCGCAPRACWLGSPSLAHATPAGTTIYATAKKGPFLTHIIRELSFIRYHPAGTAIYNPAKKASMELLPGCGISDCKNAFCAGPPPLGQPGNRGAG